MQLGLIGKSLSHSFSKEYFEHKFEREGISGYTYQNFELTDISEFPALLQRHPTISGLNVTVPYKEAILPYLDELSEEARAIGAVNTITFSSGKKMGFNTDQYGFRESLKPLLKSHHTQALVLGSGGAAKAVNYVLDQLNIKHLTVSRAPSSPQVSYEKAGSMLGEFPLVIHTTPLGTAPRLDEIPPLILDNVSENHLFYDLVYNPARTALLTGAKQRGAEIKNGRQMLELQAARAWEIWHEV